MYKKNLSRIIKVRILLSKPFCDYISQYKNIEKKNELSLYFKIPYFKVSFFFRALEILDLYFWN